LDFAKILVPRCAENTDIYNDRTLARKIVAPENGERQTS
jgi:hypothetical protein